ncbi:hypothetical protein [Actinophytocola gossypii]|uniref:Uncharacterized protein n=1 Tax=Actinophytocola gossypii TaxID=2812003 RepID=A0ABT2J7P6_9PSEU|nr:hypothetical protein [Actinophytocola gossypii]MCT2583877.1 hypothetical protein [Actinophytocola gossypii]
MVDVTVQWVHTSWTKRSRGGAAATRRNTAPIGFVVPNAPIPFAHLVTMSERQDFHPEETVAEVTRVEVSLHEADGRLRVLPRVNPLFGLPPRPRRPPAVRLAPGQWVRWQLNYRFSSAAGMQDWSYWLDTFNIAYGPVHADVFLGAPTHLVDERGPLR